jgi:hypothetical protein
MRSDHYFFNINPFDLIPPHALGGVRMEEVSVGIPFLDNTVFSPLLAVRYSCFDGQG